MLNYKSQITNLKQYQNTNVLNSKQFRLLGFRILNLFGAWNLVLGICLRRNVSTDPWSAKKCSCKDCFAKTEDRSRKSEVRHRGQALVEVILIFPILLTLIFGVIQLAMIAEAMYALNDAANMAARAASVGKSANLAAAYVIGRTIGLNGYGYFAGVSTRKSTINSRKPKGLPGTIQGRRRIKIVECTVRYMFKPMLMKAPILPLSASARAMVHELPEGVR
ncbi:MAG: pilus assembly protein [Elusimicrobia bacterium]|nr:pilus assembly protein [Elusimicrobiota bacterium]